MLQLLLVLLLVLCAPAQAMNFVLEGGASRAQGTPDGVWYQKGTAPYEQNLSSATWSVGLQQGKASVGYLDLLRASTSAKATVRDEDYSVGQMRCLDHCDALADFRTKGRVRGIFARYQFDLGHGTYIEPGLLLFLPTTTVVVSNWREGGLLTNPAVTGVYEHKPRLRLQVAPSVGIGYQRGNVGGVLRLYAAVKTNGGTPQPDGTKFMVVSPYAGLVVTATIKIVL